MTEIRQIVRIANTDLDGTLPLRRSIRKIKGISYMFANAVVLAFERKTKISRDTKLGEISQEYDDLLEDIIKNPNKYGIPSWLYNRRKDPILGKDIHVVSDEIELKLTEDIKREAKLKSYRGLRHMWNLPVRGQQTRTGRKRKFVRKKRPVGVVKDKNKK